MIETIKVTCPDCRCILIVDKKTGEVIEKREPILEESTGDRFEDAFLKVKSAKDRAEEKFRAAQEREKDKKKKLDELFSQKLREVKERGDTGRPDNPLDMD